MDRSILFVFLSLSLYCNLSFQVHAFQSNGTARFRLIHRHSPELGNFPGTTLGPPSNKRERLRQLMRSDNARLQTIARRLFPRRKNVQVKMWQNNNLVELPIRSAADIGTGQYFVSFRIGSPPRKFIMIIDSGSSLTWMKCKYKCKGCFKDRVRHNERILDAKTSRTFRPIPCSSDICKQDLARSFSLQHCPRPSAPCSYDYRYSDGPKVLGFFGNDTAIVRLTDGRKVKVPAGSFEWHSFALKEARKFGYKFSYCLVDHLSPSNLVNFLVFGDANDLTTPKLQYTELILGIERRWGYCGLRLQFNSARETGVRSSRGCFKGSVEKIQEAVIGLEGPDICFDDTGYKESMMPKLVIHFADGAKLTPPVKSYVLDAADEEKCLGFTSTPWPGSSVIGNILQQNHLWEFDLLNSRLGFAPSSCTYE
ncbi:Aspartic proteinase A1 isoform 1 [Hibiscus syriacus]|uniref:Aspartic proteinase A1 isoform 1 n=1 Tax=Hibiscus syriacus TaxID=106335 RepID=A0A6A2X7C7_HIBSY|nr:Aspartic proteinase A1 isoform 1 [Hibiscus syriacus]